MSNTDIQALLNGTAAIQTKIEILPQVAGESSITLTESNGVVSWDYEDFRFIKDQGFIGQFIAKQVTGTIKNPSDNFSMTDREFKLQMGIKVGNTLTWYSLGNFLVKKVTDDEVGDTTKFEALDYTKKFNKKYKDTITYPCTMSELAQNVCEQCGCELGSTDFKHKDWIIDGNYFQNNESCRDVMKNLGKLAYSWVRVDWDNKVYFDFTKKTTVDDYNKITSHEYYSLTTQKEKKIINRVVIGYSNIDGEQTKVEDTASIEANGLCEITIFDNPLVYSQALREKAIVGASDLLGLEYTPLEMQTVGHPWLKGYELIETTDMEGKVYKTIPFNRTIQYFGHIKSLIKIETGTKTNTEYAYESGLRNDFLNAQIQVNKKLGTITSTVDEMNTKVEDITTTTQTSTGGNSLYLKEALESNALEYSIDGKCEQSTRSGKNLAKIENNFNQTLNGITCKANADGSVTLTGTATAHTTFIISNNLGYQLDTYTISAYNLPSDDDKIRVRFRNANGIYSKDGNQTTIFELTKNATIITGNRDVNRIDIFVFNGKTVNNTIKFQLEQGSTATEWEQYGASPSPDYPSEIKTIKGIRNLLNLNVPTSTTNGITCTNNNDGSITINGHTTAGFAYYLTNDNITFEKGKKYTISAKILSGSCTNYTSSTSWAFEFIADKNNSNATLTYIGSTTKEVKKTFDGTNSSAKPYLWFGWNSSTTENDAVFNDLRVQFMVEESDTKHSFVPYGTYEKIRITGKNVLKIKNGDRTANGITSVFDNTKVKLNGTTTTTYANVSNRTYNEIQSGNYIFSINRKLPFLVAYRFVYEDGSYTDARISAGDTSATVVFLNKIVNYYMYIGGFTAGLEINEEFTLQLEKGTEVTDYEPYKEKEVLIDLAKENLLETPYTESNKLTATATKNDYYAAIDYYAELEAGKTYTFSCKTTGTFGAGNQQTQCYLLFDKKYDYIIHMDDKNCFKFTPTQTGKYYVRYDVNIKGETHSFWDFAIYKGTNADDSYELNSIGDTNDKLEIINELANIQKRIGKVVLNGNENWFKASDTSANYYGVNDIINATKNYDIGLSSHFVNINKYPNVLNTFAIRNDGTSLMFNSSITTLADFKSWLQANPVTVYYILKTPETITLPNTNIPLYEGINHVTLVEDLETTTSIKYLRKTPISGEYALNQDLNKTNSNLADTNNQLSQTQSDIDNTKTNLNNNYYNKEQVDSINSTTTQNITQIRNSMEQNITSTNASISKIQEEITNGVSKVTTTTGTFDENGLNISKSGQPMSSTLDWDGLEVVRDKGKATETEVLTVRSAGVEAENMTVRNFFIEKPIRIEKCKSVTDSTKVGLGFFWIGE